MTGPSCRSLPLWAIAIMVPVAALLGALLVVSPSTLIVVFVAAGFGSLALFAVRSPFRAVLVYMLAHPLIDAYVYSTFFGITLGQVWGLGLIAICTLVIARGGHSARQIYQYALPLALVFGYFVSVIFRNGAGSAATSIGRLLSWILVAFVIDCSISRGASHRKVLWFPTWFGIVLLSTTIALIVQNRYGSGYYLPGSFGEVGQGPHAISMAAVLLVPMLYASLVMANNKLAFLIILGLSPIVLLSFVRTSYVGLSIVTVAVLGAAVLCRRGGRALIVVFGAGVPLACAVIFWDPIVERMGDLAYLTGGSAAVSWAGGGRVGIWTSVWESANSSVGNLLLGQGAAASRRVTEDAMGASVWAHNDALEFLICGGIFLLALYIATMTWMGLSFWRLARLAGPGGMGGFPAVALAGFLAFVSMSFLNGVLFYQSSLVMGVLLGFARGLTNELTARNKKVTT